MRQPWLAVALEELDSNLSGDALRLLLLFRRVADREMTDGVLTERQVKALAVEHAIGRRRFATAFTELRESGRICSQGTSFWDKNFLNVSQSRAQREHRREQWKAAIRTYRARESSDDTTDDSTDESSPSPSPTPTPSLTKNISRAPAGFRRIDETTAHNAASDEYVYFVDGRWARSLTKPSPRRRK